MAGAQWCSGSITRPMVGFPLPEWARTTSMPAAPSTGCTAHPRMGGEHLAQGMPSPNQLGSPPHGRGARGRVKYPVDHVGLTPAWAGSTIIVWAKIKQVRGSPPHGRGAHALRLPGLLYHGLTPAWAGSTSTRTATSTACTAHPRMGGEHLEVSSGAAAHWAHPRMGGEHAEAGLLHVIRLGSPPHGRGAPSQLAEVALTPGSPPHGRGALIVAR